MAINEAHPPARAAYPKLVFVMQAYLLVSLIAFGWLYASDPTQFHPEQLFHLLCVFFLASVVWFFGSWYLITGRLFDPYLLFLTAAILFNGGQIILEVFGWNKEGFLGDEFSLDLEIAVVYFVLLGLSSLHLGAIVSAWFAHPTKPVVPCATPQRSLLLKSVYTVGRNLLYLSILPTVIVLKGALEVVLANGYEALYQQEMTTGIAAAGNILADFIFPGTFFIVASSQNRVGMRRAALITILLYSVAKFFIGARGAAVMPLLALMWLWNAVVRPIPKVLLLSIAVVMLGIVFPVIAATRSEGGAVLSMETLTSSLASFDSPIVASISEMGGSLKTVGWTMQLVPSVRPFALGMTYLTGMLVLIPNVFSQGRHPALTWSGYDIPDFWLVWEIEPEFAERGGSFGFSFLAEAFLNFGWYGAPIVLGLLGFCYAQLVNWAVARRDPVKMALIATVVSFFLFYARGASEMVFRPLIWYSLLPYLWVKFLAASQAKKIASNHSANWQRKG